MNDRLNAEDLIAFDRPGTLIPPGPVGRLVRLVLGLLAGSLVWQLASGSTVEDLRNLAYWFWVVFGMVLTPTVINIGFGHNRGNRPRQFLVGLIVATIMLGWYFEGGWPEQTLWAVLTLWMCYLYGHLAISFVLAAILATPGCEMRSIPQLIGHLRDRAAAEHYCPSFIHRIDRWEAVRRGAATEVAEKPIHAVMRARDLNSSGRHLLIHFGVPIVALNLAGNFGGPTLAYHGAALALAWMGAACLVNALRCRRVHGYFTGPWLLLAAGVMVAQRQGWLDVGPGAWATITYGAALGVVVLIYGSESLWGRYFEIQDDSGRPT